MLVEDDVLIRMSTAEMLKDAGHQVVEAADAPAAMAALKASRIDLLLADVGLPQVSGIDLAREAVARQPDLKLVFATGDEGVSSVAEGLGAVFLPKPYGPDELAAALERARGNSGR